MGIERQHRDRDQNKSTVMPSTPTARPPRRTVSQAPFNCRIGIFSHRPGNRPSQAVPSRSAFWPVFLSVRYPPSVFRDRAESHQSRDLQVPHRVTCAAPADAIAVRPHALAGIAPSRDGQKLLSHHPTVPTFVPVG